MSSLANLRAATTIQDVAVLLGFKPSALAYVLFSKEAPAKYRRFEIAKKSGGTRLIEAPNPMLKRMQRVLADILQDCEEEIRKLHGRHDGGPHPDTISHGFVRRRSIVSNAHQHRHRRFVFNVDLKDFFPSLNFGRVRGFFIRDKNFSLHPIVATILAQIACTGNHLPQGSPCSPVIANLVGHILDVHLVRLAERNGCKYTRYADDLTFSTNKPAFPPRIAIQSDGTPHLWLAGAELLHLVALCGFELNKTKSRMQYRDSRQEVTGLVVNNKVNVRSDYRHMARAMVHRLVTTGSFEIAKNVSTPNGVVLEKSPGTPNQLQGMLGFIDAIDLHNRRVGSRSKARELSSSELTYQRFLFYKDFYSAATPVLVCEGKTDITYLTHAIRNLAEFFPRLATVGAAGKIDLKIRLYRYTERSTGRVLGLNGGHGDLQNFISTYRKILNRFNAPGLSNPVIILIDNDSAAKPMLSTIKDITRKAADRLSPYIHAFANLYVVLTPLSPDGSDSVIEDFFAADTLSTKLAGKSFDKSNKYSTASHFGKSDFAQQVVWKHASTIDFSGFTQLLQNIDLVIETHAARDTEKGP